MRSAARTAWTRTTTRTATCGPRRATRSATTGLPTVEGLARYGERPFAVWSPEEVAERTGSPVHVGGAFEHCGAIVQPALLARGMRRVAMARGVRVFERSPMTGLERDGGGSIVRTAAGRVRAGRVVLAMNAWAVRFAEIRRHVLVIGSDVVATEPVPERLREIGWTDGMAISDSRLLVNYYRTTDDGRIAFGKGGGRLALGSWLGPRFEGESPWARAAEAGLRRTYPMLARRAGDPPVDRADRPHPQRSADLPRARRPSGSVLRRRVLGKRRRADLRCRPHPGVARARACPTSGPAAAWSGVRQSAGRRSPSGSPAARS